MQLLSVCVVVSDVDVVVEIILIQLAPVTDSEMFSRRVSTLGSGTNMMCIDVLIWTATKQLYSRSQEDRIHIRDKRFLMRCSGGALVRLDKEGIVSILLRRYGCECIFLSLYSRH